MRKPAYIFSLLVAFICFLQDCQSGHIWGGNIQVDKMNAGSMTEISFKFQIEEPLTIHDYLKIVMPFPLHDQLSPISPNQKVLSRADGLTVSWSYINEDGSYQQTKLPVAVFINSAKPNIYFINFLKADRSVSFIDAVWYALYFKINDPQAKKYQQANNILPIEVYTASSPDDYAMVYDENQAFGTFYLESQLQSLLELEVSNINGKDYSKIGAISSYFFDMYLSGNEETYSRFQIDQRVQFIFTLTNDAFRFYSDCYSSARFQDPVIDSINQKYYVCNIDKINNQLVFDVDLNEIRKFSQLRVHVYIQNPMFVIKNVFVEVRLMRAIAQNTLLYGISQNSIETRFLSIKENTFSLGWGLKPDPELPFTLQIVRADDPAPSYIPFNAINIQFKLAEDTPQDQQFIVNVGIEADSVSKILPTSITNNLPSAPNKRCLCREFYQNNPTIRQIACQGVGPLIAEQQYFIGFQINFPFDPLNSEISLKSFGRVYIQSVRKLTLGKTTLYVGRSIQYLQVLKAKYESQIHLVAETMDDFVKYLETFDNQQILLFSGDFQDYPSQFFGNFRPFSHASNSNNAITFTGSEEFISPLSNSEAVAYLQNFQDLFIFIKYEETANASDIVYSVEPYFLYDSTPPTNVYSIPTVNGRAWPDFNTYRGGTVSTQQTNAEIYNPYDASNLDGLNNIGLKRNLVGEELRLVFTLDIAYSHITKKTGALQDQTGLVIIANPLIVPSAVSDFQVENQKGFHHAQINLNVRREAGLGTPNQYTLIELKFTHEDGVRDLFLLMPKCQAQMENAIAEDTPAGAATTFKNSLSLCAAQPVTTQQTCYAVAQTNVPGTAGPQLVIYQNCIVYDQFWGVKSFTINEFSRHEVGEFNFDFYLTSIDRIEAFGTNQEEISYVLINAYSIDNSKFAGVKTSLINFWTSATENIDGKFFPVLLKIQGKFTAQESQNAQGVEIFFENIDPFYTDSYSKKATCTATTGLIDENTCRSQISKNQKREYFQTLSIYDFQFSSTPSTSDFLILIPIKTAMAVSPSVNIAMRIYISTYQIIGDQRRTIFTAFQSEFSFSNSILAGNPLSLETTPFKPDNLATVLNFGIQADTCSACQVGAKGLFSNLLTDYGEIYGNYDGAVEQNDAVDRGAGFTFSADYQFYNSDSQLKWDYSSQTTQPCLFFKYIYYQMDTLTANRNNYFLQKYGVHCPFTSPAIASPSTVVLRITKLNLPLITGTFINGYGAYSRKSNLLAVADKNQWATKLEDDVISVTASEINSNLNSMIFMVTFSLSSIDLSRDFQIKIVTAVTPTFGMTGKSTTTCILSVLPIDDPLNQIEQNNFPSECTADLTNPASFVFKITNLKGILKANTQIYLYFTSIDTSTAPMTTDVEFQLFISYLFTPTSSEKQIASTTLSYTAQKPFFKIVNTLSQSQVTLSQFKSMSSNQNAQSIFQVKFTTANQVIIPGQEFFQFNLGHYVIENINAAANLKCVVLENDVGIDSLTYFTRPQYSHVWEKVLMRGLNDVRVYPKKIISSYMNAYFLQCYRFKTPGSQSFVPMNVRMLENSFSELLIIQSTDLTLPVFTDYKPIAIQNGFVQKIISGGSTLDFIFRIRSTTFEFGADSRILIIFPFYYSPNLSSDVFVSCYFESRILPCSVVTERMLELRDFYRKISINEEVEVTVSGILQPFTYETSGSLFLAFDSDRDYQNLNEIGNLPDIPLTESGVKQMEGIIELRELKVNSTYLRDQNVEFSFSFSLPKFSRPLMYGMSFLINFPINFREILVNYNHLISCKLSRQDFQEENFASACQAEGPRVKIFISQEITSASIYNITLKGIINPFDYDQAYQQFTIQVVDSDQENIFYESFIDSCNFATIQYSKSERQNFLIYYDANQNVISSLRLIRGVQSQDIFIRHDNTTDATFKKSITLSSLNPFILTSPLSVDILVGTLQQKINFYSDNSVGDYVGLMNKVADDNFYSNLPPIAIQFNTNNKVLFKFLYSNFNVYEKIKSVSLLLELDCLKPIQILRNYFSEPITGFQDLGLKLTSGKDVYTEGNGTVNRIIQFDRVKENLMQPGYLTTYQFNISGTAENSYILNDANNYISLTVVENKQISNFVNISSDPTFKDQLTANILFTCGHLGTLYYHIARDYVDSNDVCLLKNSSQIKETIMNDFQILNSNMQNIVINEYEQTYSLQCQNQYGLRLVNVQQTSLSVLFEELKPKTNYIIESFCQSQYPESNTELINFQFSTPTNDGNITKMAIYFEKPPNQQQQIKIMCVLSLYFITHPLSISTYDKKQCSLFDFTDLNQQQVRILKSQSSNLRGLDSNSSVSTSSTSTSSGSASNSTSNNTISPSTCLLDESITSISIKDERGLVLYINRNEFVRKDFTAKYMESFEPCNLIEFIQQKIDGLPQIINVVKPVILSEDPPIILSDKLSYHIGFSWIYLDNIYLDRDGFLYIMMIKKINQTDIPITPLQIKNGVYLNEQVPIFFKQQKILADGKEFNLTIYPLNSNTTYIIYMLASPDIPFENVQNSAILSQEFIINYPLKKSEVLLRYLLLNFIVIYLILIN